MRPTFIACTARSGSTLLRWLLDSHPKVSCPSETDVALALAGFQRSAGAMWETHDEGASARVRARQAAEALIEAHLREHRKTVFCDKSMSNALHLDLLAQAWMGAHFVFLHRHVMDFISSALDAQPFGLRDYGFAQYAAKYPGDSVAALAHYWLDRTAQMTSFESRTGHRTVRIRYEDLVATPVETMEPVWHLVGVDPPDDDPDEMLSRPRDAHGNADHLIWYTNRVSDGSVGTGARIPPQYLRGALRRDVNDQLSALGYDTVDDGWGAGGPLKDGILRIVHHHTAVVEEEAPVPGTWVVERPMATLLAAGHVNAGMALRSRDVRYYGPQLSGYGEERAAVQRLSAALCAVLRRVI